MQHVLSTTTSASSADPVSTRPSACSSPAIRSESCTFIWHPKVRTKKRRGSVTAARLRPAASGAPAGWRSVEPVAVARRGDRQVEDDDVIETLGVRLDVDLDVREHDAG